MTGNWLGGKPFWCIGGGGGAAAAADGGATLGNGLRLNGGGNDDRGPVDGGGE